VLNADSGARRVIDTSVAHSARVHDYWLGGQMAEAAKRYNRLARETQRHRSHAEVMCFFDGLELLEPGLVPVQRWRPASEIEARARSAMWGGVGVLSARS
jgi:S-adenosyl methyltransferase